MLSIRMRRTGSKKRPFYRVVVTEARSPREGSFLEVLGMYNPRQKPAVVEIDKGRVEHWIAKGARPSVAPKAGCGSGVLGDHQKNKHG